MNGEPPSSRQPERTVDGGALRRARATTHPTRAEILRLLRESRAPLTADQIGDAVGIHRTAAGRHLAMLTDVGLADVATMPRNGRGRPRLGYVTRQLGDAPDHAYRRLSELLAAAVRSGQSARATGRTLGALATNAPADPVDALVNEAGRLGFEPIVRPRNRGTTDIILRICPFAELADIDPETICSLHLGLAEGLADHVGGLTIEGLRLADPHRGGCILTVRRARGGLAP